MNTSGILRIAALVAVVAACGATTNLWSEENAAEKTAAISESWDAYYINDAKVGYHHERVVPVTEGDRQLLKVEMTDVMRLPRAGEVAETTQDWVVYETPEGTPVRFEYRSLLGGGEALMTGELADGRMTVTQGGRTKEIDWPEDAWLPASSRPFVEGMKFEEGEKKTVSIYVPDFGIFLAQEITVMQKEKVQIEDKEMELRRVSVACVEIPALTQTLWLDENAASLKGELNMGGIIIKILRTTMENALKEEPLGALDLLMDWSLPLKEMFYHPYTSNSALYKVAVTKEGAENPTVEYDNQKIEKREKDCVLLRITAVRPSEKEILRMPFQLGDEMKEYLEPNKYIESDYAKIADAAKKIAGGEKNAYRIAKALEKWTFDYIADKNMKVAYATAREVFDNPRGDCTEHSVLLAAMLRAAGIPSRVVSGVVYTPGMFMWHAWTEAYVGVWLPLDAAMPGGFVDASHIAFTKDSLAKGNLSELSLAVIRCLGAIRVELAEYTHLVNDVEKQGTLKGGVSLSAGMAVQAGFGVSVPGGKFKKISAHDGIFECLRSAANGEDVVEVIAAPVPPSTFQSVRDYYVKNAKKVEDLKFEGAQAFRADLEKGGRLAVIHKGDVLVRISYGKESEELAAIFDDILSGLKIAGE